MRRGLLFLFVKLLVEVGRCEFAEVVLERDEVGPLEKARSMVPGSELAKFGEGVEETMAAAPLVQGRGSEKLAANSQSVLMRDVWAGFARA